MGYKIRTYENYEHMLAVHNAEIALYWGEKDAMSNITRKMAESMGVSLDDLRGPSKARHIAHARFRIWPILQQKGYSLPQIGRYFGNRHHTTILHGIRRAAEAEERGDW